MTTSKQNTVSMKQIENCVSLDVLANQLIPQLQAEKTAPVTVQWKKKVAAILQQCVSYLYNNSSDVIESLSPQDKNIINMNTCLHFAKSMFKDIYGVEESTHNPDTIRIVASGISRHFL